MVWKLFKNVSTKDASLREESAMSATRTDKLETEIDLNWFLFTHNTE